MGGVTVRKRTAEQWEMLVACAKGKREPDLVIQGGTVLNVYSGEWMEANLWVAGERIAYVGPREYTGANAQVIDATGKVLVPGYIEPHAHPFQLYNPLRYAEGILARGTTCSVNDDLVLYMQMQPEQMNRFFEEMADLPIKMVWSVRLDPQSHVPEKRHKYQAETLQTLLESPYVWQAGEVTDWKTWVDGEQEMRDASLMAKALHKRIEGHSAGASWETLNVLSAAGVTADHEAIHAEEALRRVRLGIWTTLRHSSLRPDLQDILPGLIGRLNNWSRVMMTTDGPTPEYLKKGFSDYLVRLAMELGLDPITAYQLVTINPATYYGVDDEIGGLAPGRIADVLLLSDLREPTPELVIADGRVVAENGKLHEPLKPIRFAGYGLVPLQQEFQVEPEWFDVYTEAETFPVINLQNPAITRKLDVPVKTENGRVIDLVESSEDLCYLALLNREGKWVCNGFIQGFATKLAGLASSYTGAGEYIVIGRDKKAMAKAMERVLEIGGGIVLMDEAGHVACELPLRLNGSMAEQSVEELAVQAQEIADVMAQLGHPHYDVIYTLLFLSSTHLPELRLSSEGLFEVKTKRILHHVRNI